MKDSDSTGKAPNRNALVDGEDRLPELALPPEYARNGRLINVLCPGGEP